jgi:tetratricopeptide (TPR) repeat protein
VKIKAWHVVLLLSAALALAIGAVISAWRSERAPAGVAYSVGEVRAVHAEVTIGGREIRGARRMSDGDTVATAAFGRARVRLDDGTLVAVDGNTQFTISGRRLKLEKGRVFLTGGAFARTEVVLGGVATQVASSAVAFERKGATAGSIYCAEGELMLLAAGKQVRVTSGETATITGTAVAVAPEKAFDDWTFGLAVPWANGAESASAIPEVRARADKTDPGSALVVRSHGASVEIDGEVAVTRSRTTFFNGGGPAGLTSLRLLLPSGAIVSRVARTKSGTVPAEARLTLAGGSSVRAPAALEWAGGGVLRGDLGPISAGETVDLTIEYTEWLPSQAGRTAYRYPIGAAEPALVGELAIEVDATRTNSPLLSVNAGAKVDGRTLALRQTDVRPTADLSLELAPKVVRDGGARAYVVPGPKGEDPYVLVRTELPDRPGAGVALVVVLDTSMSVGPQALETERAVLDAVLEGLGTGDSVAVLAADQTVRPLGPEALTSVSPALRMQVRKAAAELRPGGASNLAHALQRAADLLDAPSRGKSAGSGMIVYIGDGRPSVGDGSADGIRRTLGRRSGGVPRLSAVAIGPNADPWLLAALVAGTGELYEVSDPSDAARASAALLEHALLPTLRDVELDLGPSIDRVYPRTARALLSGSTVSLVGRLRGSLPTRIGLRYRDGVKLVEQSRLLYRTPLPRGADLAKRWAAARIEDLVARGDGVEAAITLARASGLLTPWTSFVFPDQPEPSLPELSERELSPAQDAAFAAGLGTVLTSGSTLLEPRPRRTSGVSLREAAEIAVRRVLDQAAGAIRACRDARAGVRPDLGRRFSIEIAIDADGRTTRLRIVAVEAKAGDPILERCIRGVVDSLPFFAAGLPLSLGHTVVVPEVRPPRKTRCSGASQLALPVRKQLWRARTALDADGYQAAAQGCELPRWSDRRAFLLLSLERITDSGGRLRFARELEDAGEIDAANFVRREAVRQVTLFEALHLLSQELLANEPAIDVELDKAYELAKTDAARLAVVRRFLELSPHNVSARRRLLGLLEALGHKEQLVSEISKFRAEPLADAGLLSEAASTLRRVGLDEEGRRAFGELIERAPRDPWTLAYVGDRLRGEGLFEEAVAAYDSLSRAVPNDAGASLRLALAHAGAGRLDVATRLLDRISQTGGRNDDGQLGELASVIRAISLARARGGDPEVDAELERRLLQTPLPDVASVILVQSAPADDPIELRIRRERGERLDQRPDLDAGPLGVAAIRIERGDGLSRILLSRAREPGPQQTRRATVYALVLGAERAVPTLVVRELEVPRDGEPVELRFDGERFL